MFANQSLTNTLTKKIGVGACLTVLLWSSGGVFAGDANLDIDAPSIVATKQQMQSRHEKLAPLYESGAVGITQDGLIAVRDAASLPLSQRASVNALVSAENQDRKALYRDIASANGHPEWSSKIQKTFAARWLDKAQSGWWVQTDGAWVKK